jgi:hypothetical protein
MADVATAGGKGTQALAPRVRPRRNTWSGLRVTRVQRPVGSASNTFLLRALSRVVLPGVPLIHRTNTRADASHSQSALRPCLQPLCR